MHTIRSMVGSLLIVTALVLSTGCATCGTKSSCGASKCGSCKSCKCGDCSCCGGKGECCSKTKEGCCAK